MTEFIHPNLDLFTINPQSTAFQSCFEEELSSINSIDFSSSLEFLSLPNIHVMKSLNDVCLNVKLRVIKEDKTHYLEKDTNQPR